MAIKILGSTIIDNDENITVDGYANVTGYINTTDDYRVDNTEVIHNDRSATFYKETTIDGGLLTSYDSESRLLKLSTNDGGGTNKLTLRIGNDIPSSSGISGGVNNITYLNSDNGVAHALGVTVDENNYVSIPRQWGHGYARPFKAKLASNEDFQMMNGTYKKIEGWTEVFDGGSTALSGGFNVGTSKYFVPETGIYMFGFNMVTRNMQSNYDQLNFKIMGANEGDFTFYSELNDMYAINQMETGDTEEHTFSGQVLCQCNKQDTIMLWYTNVNSGTGKLVGGHSSNFYGYMVAPGEGKEYSKSDTTYWEGGASGMGNPTTGNG